ncbi:MAG: TolC family outer membrane protein [Azoarcus sp.]|jgi:outer membrane protein/protease secretion system outer membrane protein|nr:TolC family outer membrane protein [Azoarcus sp.]
MKACVFRLTVALLGGAVLVASPVRADDLLSLYREAVQADATFLAAQADTRARREAEPQALAQLLPNVSFNGSNARNSTDRETKYAGGTSKDDSDYRSYNYTLGLRQPLFRPGSYAGWRQAQAQVAGAEASLKWAEQDVGARIGTAYFDVLLEETELNVIKGQRDAYLAQLDYAQKAFQSGAGTRTDIDEARSSLDLAAAQAIEQQYRLNYAYDALKAIINRPLTQLARLDPGRMPLTPPDPARLEDWIRMAEEVNPQLIALNAAAVAADKQVNKALSGHLPTADLIAQRFKNKSDSSNTIDTKTDGNLVGVQFNVPIFSGGDTVSVVRQARAELDKARQQLEATRREVGLQIRKEFDGVTQGVHWVTAYEMAAKSAEQALASTRKGFQAGKRTTLDILTAEQNLATVRRDLNRGRYQYVLSRLRLLALVGKLNEEEIARFNGWLLASVE